MEQEQEIVIKDEMSIRQEYTLAKMKPVET